MADIEQVIKSIMSDPKFASSGNLAGRIYRDEPIILTASQMERYTPSKYLIMRKIARNGVFNRKSEAQLFYEQGRFMEDFEDDFEFHGDVVRYFPTYQALSDQELRGYFSWRTKLRRGQIAETSLSFAFIYIYELLNQIGVSSPEDGFLALKNFWLAYREIEPQIDRYVKAWLHDYVVYYHLDKSRLADLADHDFDQALLTLLNYESQRPEDIFTALNALSSYKLENSRFFKLRPDAVRNIVADVFDLYSRHYRKNCKTALFEKFFGRLTCQSYSMFASAVFCPQRTPQDFVYEINAIYKYICQNGYWCCQRFSGPKEKNRAVGSLLKNIDFLMRQKYDFKPPLSPDRRSKILESIIHKAIDQHQAKEKEKDRARIEIDLSKLQGIRAAAIMTQNKLIIEEANEGKASEIIQEKAEGDNKAGLDDLECRLLICLIYGRSYERLIQSPGLMLSVLTDSINDKLFEKFGDTVLNCVDDRPELIEDYIDQLKEMLPQ